MSFSDFDVARRTRKGNFLNQIDHLIDWKSIEKVIGQHYAPASDVTEKWPRIVGHQNREVKELFSV